MGKKQMKKIPLTQGKFAIVDDNDYEWISQCKWYFHKGYAKRQLHREKLFMHRIIAHSPSDMETDHKNGNTLDNRKENLRICTSAGNNRNRGMNKNNTSGAKGVVWHKYDNKWQAQIWYNNNIIYLGKFIDKIEAINVYNTKAKELFGEFARPNTL